ncbi:hypothetical protein ES708_05167 [subsurface metagenome]
MEGAWTGLSILIAIGIGVVVIGLPILIFMALIKYLRGKRT